MPIIATLLQTPAAFIDGIGGPELVLILVISLLLFGGKGMPNMARTLGKTIREFKKATSGIEEEIKRAMNDDPEPVVRRRPDPARGEALPSPPPEAEKPAKPATPPPAADA